MSDALSRTDVVEAFDAAVSWWHSQLDEEIADHTDAGGHPDRPTTARDYFREERGFDDATIGGWRLGWAPPDGGLYDHLHEEGFDEEVIAATGLFCENAPEKELWRGRYVFPYFAPDGTADYAIARTTGSKGGGAADYDGHPEDFLAGKYAKVAHTHDNVPLSEPILGRHTLADADEVVVAEGIADAITASEAGYAVLSPVTKEFKREHFDAVVDAVEQHNIGRVYVAPDAELARFAEIDSDDVPAEPDNIYEAVNIPTVAPGPGGGLRTANYLCEEGIDARLVELPRPSADKVDLDDYLQGWADSLDAALASAKPPQQHPKYDAATATQSVEEESSGDGNVPDSAGAEDGFDDTGLPAGAGGLYALGLGDVNPDLTEGYRGKNPLGHTGESETYFVVREHPETDDLIATDYKRPGNPRYNGLTYLLVEIDERPVEAPMGELSPAETWEAWAEARQRGLLDGDDVIPTKALEHIARERELYDFDALPDGVDELPAKAHNRSLWWVKNEWAEDSLDLDDDEEATARTNRYRHSYDPRTWEDVRYIYADDKERGRAAARSLLGDRYDLMTVAGTEELQVYDPSTGTYTDETGDLRGEIYDGLGEEWSTHELNEITAGLRQKNIVQPQELNGTGIDDPHICVKNGVLNPLTRELKDHSPEYHFVDRVPVTFDPDADTVPHEEFVDDLVDREADKKALFEMVGHALMPDANERYKKFLILTGDADNGKSAFYARVKAVLDGPNGEENNTSSVKLAKLAQNRFSVNSMYGSMANIAGEIDGKKIRNTAQIKDITGGDPTEIEPKGKESFFDTINTTLMFAANDPPIIGERDKEAIATRIVPINLPFAFVDNPDGPMEKEAADEAELEARLDTPEALSGLLNLALDGIERLEDNGGDVSLPEPPEERLRMYERTADPMREFGERCLENSPGDYVVKADVTTIYKEFAAAEGYEVGTNIGSVLHGVLRGVPSLNYTESRPENPDYADTDLPLRGWDERKFVVDRVTLTEEGMKYAEAAGLVVEEGEEDAVAEDDLPLTPAEVEISAGISDRSEAPPVRATVAAVWENRYGKPVAELVGENDSIDLQIVGYDTPEQTPLSGGAEYRLEGLRGRNPDGEEPYLELRPTTTVTKLNAADEDGEDTSDADADGDTAEAAADGGEAAVAPELPPEDAEGFRADARRLAWILDGSASMTKTEIRNQAKAEFDMNLGRAGKVLEKAVEKTRLIEQVDEDGDEYRVG
jgi:P4 family phage/plasmid primase-like protien